MSKPRYFCTECKYVWRTKKDFERPSACPRCHSKKIVFDNLTNNIIGYMIGITGIILFIWSRIDSKSIPKGYGNFAGIVGIPFLLIVILITLNHHRKNKRILEKFSK